MNDHSLPTTTIVLPDQKRSSGAPIPAWPRLGACSSYGC